MTDISADLATRELQDRIDKVADDLAYRYHGSFTREEVEETVHRARTAMTRNIKVTTYLPILVNRYAGELLAAKALTEGKVAKQNPSCCSSASTTPVGPRSPQHWPATCPTSE